jgi:hypothetical protein
VIVDSPLLAGLTLGSGRAVPEQGDSQVTVPPTIIPVTQACTPHVFYASTHSADQTSTFTEITQNLTNQAQTEVNIATLPKGLYLLQMNMASWFSFTPAGPVTTGAEIRAKISANGTQVKLLSRYPFTGSFTDYFECLILAVDDLILTQVGGITGAAQFLTVRTLINAVRIL